MTTISLDVLEAPGEPKQAVSQDLTVALVGNPNCGKTTLFNILTGLRAHTANISGTTIEQRVGKTTIDGQAVQLIDLPGMYSLSDTSPEQKIARQALMGEIQGQSTPQAVLLLLDATNIQRNLLLAGQVVELGLPTVVALNMCDLARRAGIEIDTEALGAELGCPVVPISARTGEGILRVLQEDPPKRSHLRLATDLLCHPANLIIEPCHTQSSEGPRPLFLTCIQ